MLTYCTRKFYSPGFITSFKTFGSAVYRGSSTLLQMSGSATVAEFLLHSYRKVVTQILFYKFTAWKNSWRLVSKGWWGESLLIGNWKIFMGSWRHKFVKLYLNLEVSIIEKNKFRIRYIMTAHNELFMKYARVN